jgi:hypothetical protein
LAAAAALDAGHHDEGKKMATGAMAAFKALGKKRGWAAASCMVADFHIAKQDYDQAAWRAEEGANVFQEIFDTRLEASALNTAAYAYVSRIGLRRGNLSEKNIQEWADAAVSCSSRAQGLWQQEGNREGDMTAANLLANGLLAKGMTSEAETLASESQTIAQELGDKLGEGNALLTLFQVQFKNKNFKDGNETANKVTEAFEKLGDEKAKATSWQVMTELYELPEYLQYAATEQSKAEGGGGAVDFTALKLDLSKKGHAWGRTPPKTKPVGFGHQYFRFMGMRGRPAANMRQ